MFSSAAFSVVAFSVAAFAFDTAARPLELDASGGGCEIAEVRHRGWLQQQQAVMRQKHEEDEIVSALVRFVVMET